MTFRCLKNIGRYFVLPRQHYAKLPWSICISNLNVFLLKNICIDHYIWRAKVEIFRHGRPPQAWPRRRSCGRRVESGWDELCLFTSSADPTSRSRRRPHESAVPLKVVLFSGGVVCCVLPLRVPCWCGGVPSWCSVLDVVVCQARLLCGIVFRVMISCCTLLFMLSSAVLYCWYFSLDFLHVLLCQ